MKDLTDFLYKYNQIYEIVDDKVVCKELDLDFNNLIYLPKGIGDIICERLYLRNNNLKYLPKLNENITHLYLTNNNLTSLPILNKNIKSLSIDNFNDLTNLLYLPNLTQLWIGVDYYNDDESLPELLNKLRHQKVMNKMNKILETL